MPNGQALAGCQPDLAASFDFARYQRPNVPAVLEGTDFSNSQAVSDAMLLSFLGENAMTPGGAAVPPSITILSEPVGSLSLNVSTEPERSYRILSSPDLQSWSMLTHFVSTDATFRITDRPFNSGNNFFRAVSP